MQMKVKNTQLTILLTAILLGVLIVIQSRSFTDLTDIVGRDNHTNVFKEIQILKKTAEDLDNEIKGLEDQLSKATNQQKALEGIKQEIETDRILAGQTDIAGPGVALEIKGDLKSIWFTDIVNELFAAGAEAVSVNNIRLTEKTGGFDTIPNGQILFNSVILKQPFTFAAIGDSTTLEEALKQPQGILERLSQSVGGVTYELTKRELIRMEKTI